MGKLEAENKKNIRRTKIQEAILLSIASGGRMGGEMLIKQAIDYLIRCYCEPKKDSILISSPTFSMYKVYADIQDVNTIDVPLDPKNNFQPPVIPVGSTANLSPLLERLACFRIHISSGASPVL